MGALGGNLGAILGQTQPTTQIESQTNYIDDPHGAKSGTKTGETIDLEHFMWFVRWFVSRYVFSSTLGGCRVRNLCFVGVPGGLKVLYIQVK